MQNVIQSNKYILILFTFLSLLNLKAQNTCLEKVELATKKFNAGDFVTSLNSLIEIEKSDDCNLSMSERENILTLIVRNLIELDWIEEIDLWDKKLYENNPYFKPKEDILEEDFMLYLSNHYAKPKLDISVNFGTRFNYIERLKTYSIYEMLDYSGSVYTTDPQPSFGASFGYFLNENHKISFNTGFHRMSNTRYITGLIRNYDEISNDLTLTSQNSSLVNSYYNLNDVQGQFINYEIAYTKFDEELKSASVGLDYKFILNFNDKFSLSPQIGYQMNFIYDVEHSIFINYFDIASNEYLLPNESSVGSSAFSSTFNSSTLDEIDRLYTRNNVLSFLNIGLEFLYKFKKFTFFVNSSFQYGFKNFVNQNYSIYSIETTLKYKYYYVDEDYILHFLTTSAGLKYNLKYKVK